MSESAIRQPNRARLLTTTAAVVLAAAAVFTAFILPSEYGVDPTGVGDLLGITGIAGEAPTDAETGGSFVHPTFARAPGRSTMTVTLGSFGETEVKALLDRGAVMTYSWNASNSLEVYFEFHAEPTEPGFPDDYFASYLTGTTTGMNGALVAPFTGRHGWYFRNAGLKEVTIQVEAHGFQTDLIQPM